MEGSNFIQKLQNWKPFAGKVKDKQVVAPKQEFTGYTGGGYRPLYAWYFNGEKNLGEIGPIKSYVMDYEALRLRSWQAYLESEIAQTVINKYVFWEIGPGLKTQAEPDIDALESEGINLSKEEFKQFCKSVEGSFRVYADSKQSDYTKMRSFNYLQKKIRLNALLGGDVVVLLRFGDGDEKTKIDYKTVNVQLVDATHIISPRYGNEWYPYWLPNGNRIVNGIELSPTDEHIAYHIRKPGLHFETQRVPCKTEDGLTVAFMVYGLEYRIDNKRGIPLLSAVLETLKKMERYKEATLGSAEERQKIAYTINHKDYSTGQSPLQQQLSRAYDVTQPINDQLPADQNGKELANLVAATTNKMAFNMVPGAELKLLESKNELYFKDFYTVHIDIVCACLGIPPDVAMSKYNENYSASRAAIKDWEHTLNVARKDFADQVMSPIYKVWFVIRVLQNKINAPGFLKAYREGNWMVIDAYLKARFVGSPVPHIDPLKEVQAERAKLGILGEALPLTTLERATEILNGGDSDHNLNQFADEMETAESLDIKNPEPVPATPLKGIEP